MASPTETFAITEEQAEYYEARFVPALFAEWAPHLVDLAEIGPGDTVLDVACGTGVVAREVADRLDGTGRVVGLDLNDGMLTVARRLRGDIEWRQGDAANLPFVDSSFDAVLCQSAMMFFPDVDKALREMARVAGETGTVAVQVYSSLDAQPGYGRLVEIASRHAGPDAIRLLGTYWSLGDLNALRSRFTRAGLEVTTTRTRMGTARFDSIEEMVRTEVEATPLVDRIDEVVYSRIIEDAHVALRKYETGSGAEVPIEGHLVAAQVTSA